VARADSFERCTVLTLEGRGSDNQGRVFHAITPFDHLTAAAARGPVRRPRRGVLRGALGAIARQQPALGLWTVADATLDLLAYQLEPALAVLRGATRVLLADAVGLGKTVQAGLVLAELRARHLADHALVLCPAGLRDAWVQELRDRFGIAATVLDQVGLAMSGQSLPPGVNPWAAHPVVVASIDLVKRPEVLAAVEEVPFDLVIADEAHHLTPASDRGLAVNRLGSRAPWLVLVSATPHSGDQAAFDYLAALGALGDPLTIFRRRRHDIGLPDGRRARVLSVTPTPDEQRSLAATHDYARAIWQAQGRSERAVQLVAILLTRRAASSAAALERTLVRRRALLAGAPLDVPRQGSLPWEEVDDEDGDELDDRLARPGLLDRSAERRRLEALIDLAQRAATRSSKLSRLQRFLERAREPAVVFTEYRDTLEAAAQQLATSFRVGSIHGGVPAPIRQDVIRQFERGEVDVLLATDTAGEGLNLHRRCRLVIDLELPWNPRRIEQRVGRVDRLGQRRRVHAVHLVHQGTVEATVWSHLEGRRRRAEHAMGDDEAPTEEAMARVMFDGLTLPVRPGTRVSLTRIEAAAGEQARATAARAARATAARAARPLVTAADHRAVFAVPRGSRVSRRRAVALYERAWLGSSGSVVGRCVFAKAVALEAMTPGAWRQAAATLADLATAVSEAAPPPEWQAVLARIAAARARLSLRVPAHQASLFDRRAELAVSARREVAARLIAALDRRAASLAAPSDERSETRLIAFWPLRREP
jgi:superfamily II DNA or RNA helicase